ncbi:MAG: hypothetical protein RL005_1725 [Planctomycetota bacterium]
MHPGITSLTSTTALAASLALTASLPSSAHAQCDFSIPPDALCNIDEFAGADCADRDFADANGGCGTCGQLFQPAGNLADGTFLQLHGTIGSYPVSTSAGLVAFRDLDWYLVDVKAGGFIDISMVTAKTDDSGPIAQSEFQILRGGDCRAARTVFSSVSGTCPNSGRVYLEPGEHLLVFGAPLEPNPPAQGPADFQWPCTSKYLVTIEFTAVALPGCSDNGGACLSAHDGTGCADPACCNAVCALDPACCETAWDADCAASAGTECELFAHACSSPAGAPANDCILSPAAITLGSPLVVDNSNAGTDGPIDVESPCQYACGKDLWYRVQAPGRGNMTLSLCAGAAATDDSVIEVYGLGAAEEAPAITAELVERLPSLFIGCRDDTCIPSQGGGPTTVYLPNCEEDEWFLVRIGGWYDELTQGPESADEFSLTLVPSFERVIFDTGPQHAVKRSDTGDLVNLGITSGCVNVTNAQRWMAQAFVMPAAEDGFASWRVRKLVVKGFIATQYVPTTTHLAWTIWRRTGSNRPINGDQVQSGIVPLPTPYNEAEDDTSSLSTYEIPVDLLLEPGAYYLSVWGANTVASPDGTCDPASPAAFAWFVSAWGGANESNPGEAVPLSDSTGTYMWRSAIFPGTFAQGFLRVGSVTNHEPPCATDDVAPYWLNACFRIVAEDGAIAQACPGDFNGDGQRDGADLGQLLSAWGTEDPIINLTGDPVVDGADLGVFLTSFATPCP